MTRDQLTSYLALLIAGVWAIVALASMIIKDYTALAAITPVMLIVTGFLFGVRGNGKDKE
jgi:hypothetical protein